MFEKWKKESRLPSVARRRFPAEKYSIFSRVFDCKNMERRYSFIVYLCLFWFILGTIKKGRRFQVSESSDFFRLVHWALDLFIFIID